MTGLEDGLLPHLRSMDDPEGMAEERRLMYVGLTRAEDEVYLTYAFRRYLFGSSEANMRSRFLDDIPAELTEGTVSAGGSHQREMHNYERETTWDWDQPRNHRPSSRGPKIIEFPKPEPAKPALQYKSGMRVQHDKFGEGVVVESQAVADDEEVTVAFTRHGIKRLAASFARLTVLDGK
jgi:DNA helicase-2/ATP-dependent DNA helicase PcrA